VRVHRNERNSEVRFVDRRVCAGSELIDEVFTWWDLDGGFEE
jgi:hypothetical protein